MMMKRPKRLAPVTMIGSQRLGVRQPPNVVLRQRLGELGWRESFRRALPALAFVGLLGWAVDLRPAAFSYTGLTLLLSAAVPLALAAVSQMFIIMLGDIDLGIGYFVGVTNVVAAVVLPRHPVAGCGLLALFVVGYMVQGALVEIRKIPAIIVTLGASFVWLGAGLLLLPIPGGKEPTWLGSIYAAQPPVLPLPILIAVILAIVTYGISFGLPYSSVMRGAGGNALAVQRSGWSLLRVRVTIYGLAGVFGVLAGIAVTGVTASGDVNASSNYTLLAIAAVILGGGEFSGGLAVPVGTVLGAFTISLVGSVLALLNVSSNYQTGAQGLILLLVLAGRAVTRRRTS